MGRVVAATMLSCAMGLHGGCLSEPDVATQAIDDARCFPMDDGHACLDLRIRLDQRLKDRLDAPPEGVVHWSLYDEGDVGLLGPGDHESVDGGRSEAVVDYTSDEVHAFIARNLPPGGYHALAFQDLNGDGAATSGEPVTFPQAAFDVVADELTVVDVWLDTIKP